MEEAKELRLKVPWGYIAGKSWGSPKNFPVLFVHGLLDNAGAFDRLIACLLTSKFYYVSVDLPGHGLSSHFPQGMVVEFYNYVLCIRLIIEGLKWKKFHYVGHSLGGQLGIFYSILYPNQIQKFVSVEGLVPMVTHSHMLIPQIQKLQNSAIDSLTDVKPKLYSYDEVIYSLSFMRGNCLKTEAAEALFKRATTEFEGMYKLNRDIRLKSYVGPLLSLDQVFSFINQVKVETLLFFTIGTIDAYNSTGLIQLTKYLETFENVTVIYTEGNHDVHNNYPEWLARDITKFFNKHLDISSKL